MRNGTSENLPARGKLQHFPDLILYTGFILYLDFFRGIAGQICIFN